MTTPEILLAATRYEKLRKLNAREFAILWGDSLFTDTAFDELVDGLPEPFQHYLKEEPKTCQTCKHWSNNAKKKPKFVYTSMGECKKIFKRISANNYDVETHLPFFESCKTNANFGCNGYEETNEW